MTSWRVFMSPSRDISNSQQDMKQGSLTYDQDKQFKQKHNVTVENEHGSTSQQMKRMLIQQSKSLSQVKTRSTHKKNTSLIQNSNLQQKYVLSTSKPKHLLYKLILNQREISNQRDPSRYIQHHISNHMPAQNLGQSFDADQAFIQSSTPKPNDDDFNILDQINIVEDDEKDTLNNDYIEIENEWFKKDFHKIKSSIVQNNQMIHMLSAKIDMFQREQLTLKSLKQQLQREQQTNRTLDKKIDSFQSQLHHIQRIVNNQQQQQINQNQTSDNNRQQPQIAKKRSKSSIIQPKINMLFNDLRKQNTKQKINNSLFIIPQYSQSFTKKKNKLQSTSQLLQKRKIMDLDHLKQTIRQALQEVYYEYLDEE